MLTGKATVAWLDQIGIGPGRTVDVEQIDVGEAGVDVPDMPHRLALVYPTSGAGQSLQGVLDSVGFQLRIRWEPNDPNGAQRAALLADRLISRAADHCPMWIDHPDGRTWLLFVERVGGRPTPLGDAPSADGDRTTYVCTYAATVAEHDWNEEI